MTKTTIIHGAILAIATTLGVAMGGTAQAAVTTPPLNLQALHTQSVTTQVYWVYRHHRRYWVPDRRRPYRR